MFGKKKETKSQLNTGNTSHYEDSTVKKSGNVLEQRKVSITHSSYTSEVKQTRVETISKIGSTPLFSIPTTKTSNVEKSYLVNHSDNKNLKQLRPIGSSSTSSKQNSLFTPSALTTRREKVNSLYQLDAKPFNPPQKSPSLSTSSETGYQSPFSRRLTPYSSYRVQPVTPSATITTSPSTQSLQLPTERYQDPRIPTYSTSGKKRGKVLVINNIKFLKEQTVRKGAEIDEKNVCKLFRDMGFDVENHRNLKQSEMLDKIKKFKNDGNLKKVDMSIVIIMSHGNNLDPNGYTVQGGFTQIFGSDDKGLSIDEVLNQFSTVNCSALSGKPKIFIFQCCRGSESETLHIDAAPMRDAIKKHGDMLIAFSTLPGFYSLRDTKQGSWYIQSVCEVFQKHAKEFDIETLLKIVDKQLSSKHPTYQQTSTYESRGFKRCFLNPK